MLIAIILFLLSIGVLSLPLVGAVFLFRLLRFKTNRLRPVRILILLILALLPLYWTAFCFQILPLPSGNEVAVEAYNFYARPGNDDPLPEQLVGGGYWWFPEGSDLWIRFQDEEAYDGQDARFPCDSETVRRMSKWFARRVPTRQDREKLKDYDNLTCSGLEKYHPIPNDWLFGVPPRPKNCSESWRLYHRPSRFVYYRVRCHVI